MTGKDNAKSEAPKQDELSSEELDAVTAGADGVVSVIPKDAAGAGGPSDAAAKAFGQALIR
jgi:hypothetical protein